MSSGADLVLNNVTLPDGRVCDISICDGSVIHAGAGYPSDRTIDCTGYLVLPGATDCHVHMRGWTQSAKEDWVSGSRSAIAGGVTLVVDQPNTVPAISTPEIFRKRLDDARQHSACHFAINSAVTERTSLRQMWYAGAIAFGETFASPSSYGEAISAATLGRALAEIRSFGGLATIHAEKVTAMRDPSLAGHDKARPVQGEAAAVREVLQANTAGCKLHFCHLSSAAAIGAVQGASVEVTPHHLFLSHESFRDPDDAFGKVNPPLRTEQERKHLWRCWNAIDIIASDHAPHTIREKRTWFRHTPSGIPGVETMVPLLVAKVLDRTISHASLIRKTSDTPARILGIKKAGFDTGDRADFALYSRIPVRIHADDLHSRSAWSPYEGMPAVFPTTVIMEGTVIYRDGQFFPGTSRWFAGRGVRRS